MINQMLFTSSLWTPAQLSGLALWLDAADAGTITLNGSTVSQWNDKSGNARHVSQATGANQPTRTLNGLNGLPVVTFDGGIKFLSAANTNISAGDAVSMVSVYQSTGNPDNQFDGFSGFFFLAENFTNAASRACQLTNTRTKFIPAYFVNPFAVNQISLERNSNYNIHASVGDFNDTHSYSINGATPQSQALGAPNISNINAIRVGNASWDVSGLLRFIGNASEIIVTNTALSTTDRQKLEGYLAWKWGLQASLPAGHPSKNSPPYLQ
jgi:hypothetical protein